jgi:PII-like signaling protein
MPHTLVPVKQLTLFVNSTDQWHGQPLYSAIVRHCLDHGIAGATVVRCIEGYGSHHHLHTTRLLQLSEDLPVRIEVIDTPEKVAKLLDALDGMIDGGLTTIRDADVVKPTGASS